VRALIISLLLPAALLGADRALAADAAPAGTFEQRLELALDELRAQKLSLVIGVAHGARQIQYFELGAAAQDSIPPEMTQVDINSITKTVTAVMVLKLIEQGKLQIQESLGRIFPGVPPDKSAITVHQLLTHSAGFVESIGKDEEPLEKDAFLQRAFDSRLRSVPGKEYHYSNVGFSVLAAIIEQRSGKPYDQSLQQDVLANTDLHHTGYLSVYDEKRSLRTAQGKTIREASWGGHAPYWNLTGNGGLISTVEDFIHFRQAVKAGEIIAPELVRASQEKHIAENAQGTSHYGYGLVVQDDPAIGRFYWHDGGNDVFSAMWIDCADRGDILFTAGADARAGNAITAMAVLLHHLFGTRRAPD
jgi:CubicO group peptidase (beta-lactamase class C family)